MGVMMRCCFLFVGAFLSITVRSSARYYGYPLYHQRQFYIEQITNPVQHAEGPHWYAEKQVLLFVSISDDKVYQYHLYSRQLTSAAVGAPVSVIIPIRGSPDQYIIGRSTGLTRLTWNGVNTTSPGIEVLSVVDQDKPGNRFNDGKADVSGRLWIGTMGKEEPIGNVLPKRGTLYKVPDNDSCQLMPIVKPVSISNGIAWSRNNTIMYYIDTPTRVIMRYDYDIATGNIKNPSVAFNFSVAKVEGSPDGMTIDNLDNLWIACWGGWQVINVDTRTKQVINVIKMPVERVTSVTFGGHYYNILFVTTMKQGLTAEQLKQQPLAGAVFAVHHLGVCGHYNNLVNDCQSYGTYGIDVRASVEV